MHNNCDLEEVKHVALQKFLELSEHPEQWTSSSYYPFDAYIFGKFKVRHYYGSPEYKSYYTIDINYQTIWSLYSKEDPNQSDPVFLGIKKIMDFDNKRKCDEQKEMIIKATRESCLKIQEALKDPNIIIYESNKEGFWRKLIHYLHS